MGWCGWEAVTVLTHANQLLCEEETVAVGLEMLMILMCAMKSINTTD